MNKILSNFKSFERISSSEYSLFRNNCSMELKLMINILQKEKDSGPTRAAGSQVPMSSEEDCMDRLPHQFQNWARSLLDERKTLKEQNSLLKNNSSLSGEQLQNFQAKLNSSMDQLRQTERTKLRLENDLDNVNTKLLNVERELTQERAKNQQMRLDIEDADTIAASWNKKFSEKSGQLESNKNRCSELETQVFQLQEQIASLQGQLRSLQVCSVVLTI